MNLRKKEGPPSLSIKHASARDRRRHLREHPPLSTCWIRRPRSKSLPINFYKNQDLFDRLIERFDSLTGGVSEIHNIERSLRILKSVRNEFRNIENAEDSELKLILIIMVCAILDDYEQVRLEGLDMLLEFMNDEEGFWTTQLYWKEMKMGQNLATAGNMSFSRDTDTFLAKIREIMVVRITTLEQTKKD